MNKKDLIKKANQESADGKNLTSLKEEKKILAEFEKNLDIPNKKPEKKIILCPVGLVGAGKTTVLKPLSKKLGLIRISGDELRMILKKYGYNFIKTEELSKKIIFKYLKKDYSIAADFDCISHKKVFSDIAKEYNAKIFWIHINPPEAFIIKKLKNIHNLKHDHPKLFKNAEVGLSDYFRRKPLHAKINFPFIYVFNTSKNNLKEQIEEAYQKIKNKI